MNNKENNKELREIKIKKNIYLYVLEIFFIKFILNIN